MLIVIQIMFKCLAYPFGHRVLLSLHKSLQHHRYREVGVLDSRLIPQMHPCIGYITAYLPSQIRTIDYK